MNSGLPSEDQVIADLGSKVVGGLALMVAQTREDLRVYRKTFPTWAADSTDRGLLNWAHDRLWAHAVRIFEDISEVTLVDRPPLREVRVGLQYRLRVKKHDIEGRIATYPTQGALAFLEQEQLKLDGLGEVALIAGYRWDAELRQIGSGVISLRDGLQKPIWTYELTEPVADEVVSTVPVLPSAEPRAPQIGLASDRDRAEGTEEQ